MLYDKSERRSPEDGDEPVADPRAETALHHGARDQEGQDDQQNRRIREARVGLLRGDDAAQDGGGNGDKRCREDRQRAGDHGKDRRGKDGEETPGLDRQAIGRRREPDTDRQYGRRDTRCCSPDHSPARSGCIARTRAGGWAAWMEPSGIPSRLRQAGAAPWAWNHAAAPPIRMRALRCNDLPRVAGRRPAAPGLECLLLQPHPYRREQNHVRYGNEAGARPSGRQGRAPGCLLRRADRARPRQLRDFGNRAAAVSRFDRRARHGQAGGGARQFRLRSVQPRDPAGYRRRLHGDHRRRPARPVSARRVPGWRRHVNQHERQRGHRQPRARVDGPQEGASIATATRTIT